MKKIVFQLMALFTIAAGSLSVSCNKNGPIKKADSKLVIIQDKGLCLIDSEVEFNMRFRVEPKSASEQLAQELEAGGGIKRLRIIESTNCRFDIEYKGKVASEDGYIFTIHCKTQKPFYGYLMMVKLQFLYQNRTLAESEEIVIEFLKYIENGKEFGRGTFINGIYWAPANCGSSIYEKGGLHYQWGRKDGHRPDETPTFAMNTRTDTPDPNVFYCTTTAPYDWRATPDTKLWNAGDEDNPIKTQNDPCPEGWRVPTKKEWDNMKDITLKWNYLYKCFIFFKEGGVEWNAWAISFREFNTGNLHTASNHYFASFWTATDNKAGDESYSIELSLANGEAVKNMTASKRSKGASIRCVKE